MGSEPLALLGLSPGCHLRVGWQWTCTASGLAGSDSTHRGPWTFASLWEEVQNAGLGVLLGIGAETGKALRLHPVFS